VVETPREDLSQTDFAPFRALATMPWAMTAHIVYDAVDPHAPATLSRPVIEEIIRAEIGFDGVLVSDDLSMRSLGGKIGDRARQALTAGCDLALHCNGDPDEMEEIVAAVGSISTATAERLARAEETRRCSMLRDFDRREAETRLDALPGDVQIAELKKP
jgi:beta-N-acetylhexosaminidase